MTPDDYFRARLLACYRRSRQLFPLWNHRARYEWAKMRARLDTRLAGFSDGTYLGWWHADKEDRPK